MKVPDLELIAAIRARLEREPCVNFHRSPVALSFDHGDLVVEGEVEAVAAKKRTLEIAAEVVGAKVGGIIDRLHVAPSQRMSDGEILDHLLRQLSEESALQPCALTSKRGQRRESFRKGLPKTPGQIEVSVVDGIVTLDGEVTSLAQKRLCEGLAWWVPGTRDVVNGLGVNPPEEDSDDDITDALKMVLEKDPLLKGLKIGVSTEHRVVTLTGTVQAEEQRRAAEEDGWCLFGVDRVVSRLQVRPRARAR